MAKTGGNGGRSGGRAGSGVVARIAGLSLAVWLGASGEATAQDAAASPQATEAARAAAPLNDADLKTLVAKLNDPDVREREQATVQMLDDARITLQTVSRLLTDQKSTLSPEQRTRLLVVARDRFMKSDRAALGFQFGGQLQDRIVVGQTYPKFPSFTMLEVGDIIVGAEGVDLVGPAGRLALQAIIVSRDPGDALALVIRRGKEKLELNVPLGKFGDLDQPGMPRQMQVNRPTDPMLQRAWKVRSRLMSPGNKAIEFASGWKTMTTEERNKRRELMNKRAGAAMERPAIAGGGMARVGLTMGEDMSDQPWQVQMQVRQLPQAQLRVIRQGMIVFGEVEDDFSLQRMTPAQELQALASAKMQASEELKRLGEPGNIAPGDSRISMFAEATKRVMIIDRQIEAIEAEIRERGEAIPQVKVPQPVDPGIEAKE
jgi:hypothetical protein